MADGESQGGARYLCHHPEVGDDGRCLTCGACAHDLVLNGSCYLCGAEDVALTNKPLEGEAAGVVPAARLSGPRRR